MINETDFGISYEKKFGSLYMGFFFWPFIYLVKMEYLEHFARGQVNVHSFLLFCNLFLYGLTET